MSDCTNNFYDAMDELCFGGRNDEPNLYNSVNPYYSWQEAEVVEVREKSYKINVYGLEFFIPKSVVKAIEEDRMLVHSQIFSNNFSKALSSRS